VGWNNSGGGVVLTIFVRNDLCFLTTKRYIQELHIFQGSDSILEPLLVLFERHLVVALNTRSNGAILVVFSGQNQFNSRNSRCAPSTCRRRKGSIVISAITSDKEAKEHSNARIRLKIKCG
jgi:hypothetical protein